MVEGNLTAEFSVKLMRPAPTDGPVTLRARPIEVTGNRGAEASESLQLKLGQALQEAGIIPGEWTLPPRNPAVTPWEELTPEEQRREARRHVVARDPLAVVGDHHQREADDGEGAVGVAVLGREALEDRAPGRQEQAALGQAHGDGHVRADGHGVDAAVVPADARGDVDGQAADAGVVHRPPERFAARVFGRRAGGVGDYPYSNALAEAPIVWTAETIDALDTRISLVVPSEGVISMRKPAGVRPDGVGWSKPAVAGGLR